MHQILLFVGGIQWTSFVDSFEKDQFPDSDSDTTILLFGPQDIMSNSLCDISEISTPEVIQLNIQHPTGNGNNSIGTESIPKPTDFIYAATPITRLPYSKRFSFLQSTVIDIPFTLRTIHATYGATPQTTPDLTPALTPKETPDQTPPKTPGQTPDLNTCSNS